MIANQDNYLFLKQMLVIIEAQRKGVEVDLDSTLLEPEQTTAMALSKLVDIEDQFTIPRFVDYNQQTTIDFEKLIHGITFWTGDPRVPISESDEIMNLIREAGKPDNLYRNIVEYPLLTCYDEHKDNLNQGKSFPVSTQTVTDAANAVDGALSFINKWLIGDLTYYSLSQVIILLNCVQSLDEVFQFGNDSFIGC